MPVLASPSRSWTYIGPTPDPRDAAGRECKLREEDGVWLGEDSKEIVLKISAEVAGYFKRRKLIANQVIEKALEDGGLIVSAKVGRANQVMPIVRYWIPHIRIIRPEGLQEALEVDFAAYLEGGGRVESRPAR